MFTMRHFNILWLFILWLKMDESLQQNEIKCSVPVIENGNVVGDKQVYNEDEILDFNCSSTYMPAHHRPSKCTKFGTAALWDPTPECETILCRLSLPPPRGTTYDPPFRNLFSPGDTLGVICEDTQDTPAVTTCKDDGKWTSMPKCNGITCDRRDIQNTDIVNLKQKYRDGEQANYVCKNDYEGRFSLTCTENGWEGSKQCKAPLGCSRPPPIENGEIQSALKYNYQHDERVAYICQSWNTMQGERFKTCKNGKWIGSIKCLKPCTVAREDMLNHNILFRYGTVNKLYLVSGNFVNFICTKGRLVGTVGMRQRCIDGVISLPTCL